MAQDHQLYSQILKNLTQESSESRIAELLANDVIKTEIQKYIESTQALDRMIAKIKYFSSFEKRLLALPYFKTTQVASSTNICAPIFYLPNAKVGDDYVGKIAIRSGANGHSVIIEKILSTDDDFTLVYDSDTESLVGMPKVAGSFTLGIVWRVDGHLSETSKIEFIVNPDPNSLWKDLPADETDRYFKPNEAHQYLAGRTCQIAGASRRGRSHAHIGSFRDDDFWLASLPNGWNITIVSDGAGSAKNSRKGSEIIVQCMGEFLQEKLLCEANQDLVEQVSTWDESAHAVIGKQFKEWFRDAAVMAVQAIEQEAAQANEPVKSYSSTALAAVTLKIDDQLFAATFWVGDGAIVAYSPNDSIRVLGDVDSGEFAGQTRFLDNNIIRDTAFYDRIRIGKWHDISHFLLMTDGISDPKFATDAALLQTDQWRAFMAEVEPLLTPVENAAQALLGWMKFPSPGHHDDRTFIVIW